MEIPFNDEKHNHWKQYIDNFENIDLRKLKDIKFYYCDEIDENENEVLIFDDDYWNGDIYFDFEICCPNLNNEEILDHLVERGMTISSGLYVKNIETS